MLSHCLAHRGWPLRARSSRRARRRPSRSWSSWAASRPTSCWRRRTRMRRAPSTPGQARGADRRQGCRCTNPSMTRSSRCAPLRFTARADDRAPGWPGSAHGECLGEHRKIAVMSEAQSSELILLEPPDGIVFVQRDINRISRPTLDQPDLHVERIGMDLQDRRAGSSATSIPSSSCNSRASAAPGSSPGSTCPPGRSHTSGYQRRCGDRWHSNTRLPSRRKAVTIRALVASSAEVDTRAFCQRCVSAQCRQRAAH